MKSIYYQEIFKRKSFHLFRNVGEGKISKNDIELIHEAYKGFQPLYPEIKTAIRIVPSIEAGFKRGAEYCVLIYSEKKDNYLMNVGYLGEQLDLYLVKHNIGTLWFGIGKTDGKTYEGLNFVIMIAINKIEDESLFRKDMFKSKRKELDEIWKGDTLSVAEIARFSPSACNTQPWFVENEGSKLIVYRYKKPGKRGIMPTESVVYYNSIDIGIFLCILEICLEKEKIQYERSLFVDPLKANIEYQQVAEYTYK